MRGDPSGYAIVIETLNGMKRATNVIFPTKKDAEVWLLQSRQLGVKYRIVHNDEAPLRAGL